MLKQINLHEVVSNLQSKRAKFDTIVSNKKVYSTTGNILVISNGVNLPDGKYKIINNEFYKISEPDGNGGYLMESGELVDSFEIDSSFIENLILLSPFALKEGNERPALYGVYYDSNFKKLVATECHFLRVKDFNLETKKSFIIPAEYVRFFKKLKKLFESGKKYLCELHYRNETEFIKIYVNEYEIYFYLIKDHFPNWSAVIPNEYAVKFEFNRKNLIESLEILKKIDKRINFKLNNDVYILNAKFERDDTEIQKSVEVKLNKFEYLSEKSEKSFYELHNDLCLIMPMLRSEFESESLNFSINVDLLLTTLKSFNTETINFYYTNHYKPILIC